MNPSQEVSHECDYLVIGAGATGMSFIDTLLTESSTATVILVDRNDRPGGHWTTAYPYVQLHQPSGNYGVNSETLGKSFNKNGHEKISFDDLATGEEIIEYYEKVLDKFKTCDRFKKAFFSAEYQKEEEHNTTTNPSTTDDGSTVHSILDSNGDQVFIRCKKIVKVNSKVIVPSMRDAPFPVHEDVNYIDANKVPEAVSSEEHYTNYVVIGAGKTGSDAVVELLNSGVDQSQIKWIISQDVWYFMREGIFNAKNYYNSAKNFVKPILKAKDQKDLFLQYEKLGIVGRLDPSREFPKIFKGPIIGNRELELLRSVKDVVRLGRISSIEAGGLMKFAKKKNNGFEEEVQISSSCKKTVFIDCMTEDCYGYSSMPKDLKVYESSQINLGPLFFVFNVSLSAAVTAYLEAHITDDDMKNSALFYNMSLAPTYDNFIHAFYVQMKTLTAMIEMFPPSIGFVLNSRTNPDAPIHHGFLKFIWLQIGPNQMARKGKKMLKKIESGGFTDLKIDPEMIQRPKPDKVKLTRAKKREMSKRRKKLNKVKYPQTYPPSELQTAE